MKPKLLAALIAALCAGSSVRAAERELLFGPEEGAQMAAPAEKGRHDALRKVPRPPNLLQQQLDPSSVQEPTVGLPRPAATPPRPAAPTLPPLTLAPAPVKAASPPVAAAPLAAPPTAAPLRTRDVTRVAPDPSGADPVAERQQLLGRFNTGILVGVAVGHGLDADTFEVERDLLPVANHLSGRVGALVVPAVERDAAKLAQRIADGVYPALLLNAAAADAARAAGYLPVAHTRATVPAIVVPANSTARTLADLKAKQLSIIQADGLSTLALVETVAAGADGLQLREVGDRGYAGVQEAVTVGQSDAGVLPADLAAQLAGKPDAKLRVLWTGKAPDSLTLWIRNGVDERTSANLAIGLQGLSLPDTRSTPAAQAFSRMFRVTPEFVRAAPAFSPSDYEALASAHARMPSALATAQSRGGARAAAKAEPGETFFRLAGSEAFAKDPLAIRAQLVARFNKGVIVGVHPSLRGDPDTVSVQRDILPWANSVSERLGYAILPAFDREPTSHYQHIADAHFPVLIAPASVSKLALEAGYEPVAKSSNPETAVFLVNRESPVANLAGLAAKRLAVVTMSAAAAPARSELAAAGVLPQVRFVSADAGSMTEAVALVLGGHADSAAVTPAHAITAIESSKGRLRVLAESKAADSMVLWVRKGAFDDRAREALIAAMIAQGLSVTRSVISGGSLERLSASDSTRAVSRADAAPGLEGAISPNKATKAANLMRPGLQPIGRAAGSIRP